MASQFGSACTRHRLVRHTNKSPQLKYPTLPPSPLETKCKFIRLAESGRSGKNAQLKNIKLNLNGSVSNAKKSRPSSRHKDKELQLKCPHVWYPTLLLARSSSSQHPISACCCRLACWCQMAAHTDVHSCCLQLCQVLFSIPGVR